MKNKLIFNYMLDHKKKAPDIFERAALIREYLDEEGVSIRKLALIIDVPRSTIEDWLLWEKMAQSKYNSLIKQGYTHLEIYRSLRNNKGKDFLPIESETKFEKQIKETIACLRKREKKVEHGSDDYIKVLCLRDQINRVLMYSDKNK